MIVWFAVLFAIGVWRITFEPSILHAFNPWEAISYLIREKTQGFYQIGKRNYLKNSILYMIIFVLLGGVFLSVTGLEALYADLGTIFYIKKLEVTIDFRSFWSVASTNKLVICCITICNG